MKRNAHLYLPASAIAEFLATPNEFDSNGEAANVVDGLFFIGRAIHRLAEAIEGKAKPGPTER